LIDIPKLSSTVVTGFGYTGERLCHRLRSVGASVTAIVRNDSAHDALSALGCQIVDWNLDQPYAETNHDSSDPLEFMDQAVLFHLVPPPSQGHHDSRLRQLLNDITSAPPAAIILASTSGVYGDRQGQWIDETVSLQPATDRARRRVDAEQTAQAFCREHGVRLVILRIAGIYGPGRLPVKRLTANTPLPPSEEIGFTNRIHVDDLVTIMLAAADRGSDGAIFNVADGAPCSTRDWFEQVAQLTGLPPPPLISLAAAQTQLSPMFMSFLRESRRLDISRLREELHVELAYARPLDGIRASLAEEQSER